LLAQVLIAFVFTMCAMKRRRVLAVAHAIRKNVSGRFLIGMDANLVRVFEYACDALYVFTTLPIPGSMCSARAAALVPDVAAFMVLRFFSQGLMAPVYSTRHRHSWSKGLPALCRPFSAAINELAGIAEAGQRAG
jgi:hypothetical protein